MSGKIIVRRYSEAFIKFAEKTIGVDKAVQEIKYLSEIFCGNTDLPAFLLNQEVDNEEKIVSLNKIFSGLISEDTRIFLKLLLEKGRMHYLCEIAEYVVTRYSVKYAEYAELRTAYPVSEEIVNKIRDVLQEKLKKKLNIKTVIDKGLIGGAEIVVGNTVIDGTIKRRLEDVRVLLAAK
jgi:F-type H+-transporting ATPase subunit delta